MGLRPIQIKAEIAEKIKLGYPDDEQCLEVYGYALSLDSGDPLNLNLGYTRKILPFHAKVFVVNQNLIIREVKNGKLLKKDIPFQPSYKAPLSLFLTEEEMLEDYRKTAKEEVKKIENKIGSYLKAIKELEEAGE